MAGVGELCEEDVRAPASNGGTGNGDDGNGDDATEPQVASLVVNAVAGRDVELQWPGVSGATGYVIRYRNLDMAGSSWTMVTVSSADARMHTLKDADLEDGALYRVELRGNNQSWDEGRSRDFLGPVIQFSLERQYEEDTGETINWELPAAELVRGDTVQYTIVPALPMGLDYGQKDGNDYVNLPADEKPHITGAVRHTVGGSMQFYRLEGCDVSDEGVVDDDSCATHIFKIIINPATVKPLADVIRDRVYTVGKALDATHPLNQFPQVGLEDDDDMGFTYLLLNTDDDYRELSLPGLTFDGEDRQLSGTPTAKSDEVRVAYRATQSDSDVYHEAEFTISIVEIPRQECRVGLNYEDTLRVFDMDDTVGSANFTVRAASDSYYVLPIGEEGQRGPGENRTRTFELITVEKGGDLSAPDANVLPAGLQVVKLMVDGDSVNPLNDLYTRQGFHMPEDASTVMAQMMDDEGMYEDPEPDYPDMDRGYRLAIGVADQNMLEEQNRLGCFIVHDTDNDTGETDSSAVVFNVNILPDLSANDWVIELEGAGDTSELDVDEAFTTAPSLLDFDVMYVDNGASRNASGCIDAEADAPLDIVRWNTANDTVTFTAREVSETMTQRVQVKAELMTGGAEACVQIRITVLPEPTAQPPTTEPTALTAPTMVMATVDDSDPGAASVTITWMDGMNADGHEVGLVDLSDYSVRDHRVTDGATSRTFTNVASGRYMAIVVSTMDAEFLYDVDIVTVP